MRWSKSDKFNLSRDRPGLLRATKRSYIQSGRNFGIRAGWRRHAACGHEPDLNAAKLSQLVVCVDGLPRSFWHRGRTRAEVRLETRSVVRRASAVYVDLRCREGRAGLLSGADDSSGV